MAAFEFNDVESVDQPRASRTAEPNPFTDVVSLLANTELGTGKGKSFVVPCENDQKNETLTKIRAQLTAAGNAANVTVRWTTRDAEGSTKTKPKTVVMFKVQSKIRRK